MRPPLQTSPTRSSGSLLSRWAQPWVAASWGLFLGWTLVVAVIWCLQIGESQVRAHIAHPELSAALVWVLNSADFLWITLAAGNGYLALAASEGLGVARRWTALVFATVFAVGAVSAWTGWPLGAIRYTSRLGPKLGPVPLALPLLWFVVVLGARSLLMRVLPRGSHAQIAGAVAVIAGATDLLLEPVASRARVWWFWQSASSGAALPPALLSACGWSIVALGLSFLLRESTVARPLDRHARGPAIAFGLLIVLLLLAGLRRVLEQ